MASPDTSKAVWSRRHYSSSEIVKLLMLIGVLGLLMLVLSQGGMSGEASSSLFRSSASSTSYDVCIVGAGLSGAVIAERYASVLQKSVLVLEKRDHIGGNCYDYIDDETGIRVSKFGAHLFHTKSRRVWDYVHRFSHWTPYEHKVLGLVESKHVPIPVNIDTVNILFDMTISDSTQMDEWLQKEQIHYDHEPKNSEQMALSRVGPRLYNWIFKPYTFKQWARYPAELGPEVTARIPVRNNHDDRYFSDPYQALPTKGYTAIFERLLDSRHIRVRTKTDYFKVKDSLKCGRLYYTGPIDTYFVDLGWPKLEYRSLDFERVVKRDTDYFQPASVVNHPQDYDDFTRIVEYKHLLNQSSPHTIYFVERSKDGGEPYYPVPNEKNQELYRRYQEMASKEKNVTFVGRLANYKYFNMDEAILNALELFDKDTGIPETEQWTDLLAPEKSEAVEK
jgi:UDP-galactopyranose mutase